MKKHLHRARTLFLKAASLLLGILLGVFCNNWPKPPVALYGEPSADYKISGTVRAAVGGAPLNHISIVVSPHWSGDTTHLHAIDSIVSNDSTGAYQLIFRYMPTDTWRLYFTDMDSLRIPRFAARDTLIAIPGSTLTGGNGQFYCGHAEKQVDINLNTDLPQHTQSP